MSRINTILTTILIVGALGLDAQQSNFIGRLVDTDTGESLIGANIRNGENFAVSGSDGQFTISAALGDTLFLSYISFENRFYIVEKIETDPIEIALVKSDNILETATVTTSRVQRKLSDATVSIEVMKPTLIKNTNTMRIDDVLNKVPGVQMIDGQANIRGGSGYSYGAGSRVMLLIDNLPALQADAGFPNWTDVPIENIGQVEVVKGAASALYGSSALNGIINIRRARPKLKPETEISVGYTKFFDPSDDRKKWWGSEDEPYGYHASIVHRRKSNNWEITGSYFHRRLESFNQSTYERRDRVGFNLRNTASKSWVYGVNTMFNYSNNGSFFIWSNPVGGAFTPYAGSEATSDNRRIMIDPFVQYFDQNGGSHRLMMRYLDIVNDNNMNQDNSSQMSYAEYQYQNELSSLGANVTAGAVYAGTSSDAELFGDTTFTNKNMALYGQLDKAWDNLTMSLGARYEYNKQESPDQFMGQTIPDGVSSDGQAIFRAGVTYKLHEYSSLRANWGQGYRFPTITERFITTQFSGFRIFPNVGLRPETGWSAEIGLKQGISLLGFKGFVDLAGFWSEYTDMMEFTLVNILGALGFQSQNIGDTRIKGGEISVYGQANVLGVPINVYGGYTILDPKYQDFNEVIQNASSSEENILKYRSRRNYKLDVEAFYGDFSLGGSVQGASHVVAIDAALRLLPGVGLEGYRSVNNNGYNVLDARMAYRLDQFKLSLVARNILNSEYTVRPALLEAPRNISLRLDMTI